MKEIVVHVLLDKEAKKFASEGFKFSLVMPKVNFKEINGLETLVGSVADNFTFYLYATQPKDSENWNPAIEY